MITDIYKTFTPIESVEDKFKGHGSRTTLRSRKHKLQPVIEINTGIERTNIFIILYVD